MSENFNRAIRSFVLRQGRLTKGQKYALEHLWPRYGIETNNEPLDFNTLFINSAPITLEIGFGNGESLAQMAKAAPEQHFIGIEVHRPGVGRLLHLIEEYQLDNLRVIHDDAVEIMKHCIPKQSLDCLQLFFPDPWHKKRHNKRRIIQDEFVQHVHSLLKESGTFHLATDWKPYARHMSKVMEANAHFQNCAPSPFSERPEHRPLTKFEKRGLKLGHGVWDLLYKKI
ncbi:MAG: tRNA (guanosine(46)-N7)-methyltransferase TrmB [Cocleimonas sp.]|nr:tRNA (guanosine(46)-N7)-methyltransferase TrmB [Cocleimonas sp.]